MSTQPVRALGKMEIINLCIPFVFLIPTFWYLFTGHQPTSIETSIWRIVVAYIFLDIIHVLFTFLVMGILPELRTFAKTSWQQRRGWPIYGIVLFVYLLLVYAMPDEWIPKPWMKEILFLLPRFLFFRHGISQCFGISMLYNRHAIGRLNESEVERLSHIEKKERWMFKVFIGLVTFYFMTGTVFEMTRFSIHDIGAIGLAIAFVPLMAIVFWYPGKLWRFTKNLLCAHCSLPPDSILDVGDCRDFRSSWG